MRLFICIAHLFYPILSTKKSQISIAKATINNMMATKSFTVLFVVLFGLVYMHLQVNEYVLLKLLGTVLFSVRFMPSTENTDFFFFGLIVLFLFLGIVLFKSNLFQKFVNYLLDSKFKRIQRSLASHPSTPLYLILSHFFFLNSSQISSQPVQAPC